MFKDFYVEVLSEFIPEIVKAIRESVTPLTVGYPDERRFQLNVPEDVLLEPNFVDAGLGGGFATAYLANCVYLETPLSPPFVSFIDDLISSGSKELDLTECPGMEPGSGAAFDLNPVVRALVCTLLPPCHGAGFN